MVGAEIWFAPGRFSTSTACPQVSESLAREPGRRRRSRHPGRGHHDLSPGAKERLRRGGLGGDRRPRGAPRTSADRRKRAYYHGTLPSIVGPRGKEPERNRLRPGVSKGNPNLMANVTMMREILGVTDEPGMHRRWFHDDYFDLFVWQTDAGELGPFPALLRHRFERACAGVAQARRIFPRRNRIRQIKQGKAPDEKVDPVVSRFEAAAHALPEDIRLALTRVCTNSPGKRRHSRAPASASAGHPWQRGLAAAASGVRFRPELTPSGKLGLLWHMARRPEPGSRPVRHRIGGIIVQTICCGTCLSQVLIVVFLVVAIAGLGVGLGLILSREKDHAVVPHVEPVGFDPSRAQSGRNPARNRADYPPVQRWLAPVSCWEGCFASFVLATSVDVTALSRVLVERRFVPFLAVVLDSARWFLIVGSAAGVGDRSDAAFLPERRDRAREVSRTSGSRRGAIARTGDDMPHDARHPGRGRSDAGRLGHLLHLRGGGALRHFHVGALLLKANRSRYSRVGWAASSPISSKSAAGGRYPRRRSRRSRRQTTPGSPDSWRSGIASAAGRDLPDGRRNPGSFRGCRCPEDHADASRRAVQVRGGRPGTQTHRGFCVRGRCASTAAPPSPIPPSRCWSPLGDLSLRGERVLVQRYGETNDDFGGLGVPRPSRAQRWSRRNAAPARARPAKTDPPSDSSTWTVV